MQSNLLGSVEPDLLHKAVVPPFSTAPAQVFAPWGGGSFLSLGSPPPN